MTSLAAFAWQLPAAIGLVYVLILVTEALLWIIHHTALDRLMTRWSRGMLRGTGDPGVDMLRASGYSLRAARRMSRKA